MNTESLEQTVRRYADMVYRLALAHTRNPADAEDIFQDVFLRYAEKSPHFRDEEHRKAWLLRVTVNRCHSHFRSAWFRHTAPMEAAADAAAPAEQDSPLPDALARLPARQRTAIHLHYYEGMSTGEIAAVTGQRPSTVRSQLTRARNTLRQLLKGGFDDV